MGKLVVTIGVGDQQGGQFEDLEVTVDTGSTFTAVPRALLQRLRVPVRRSAQSRLADGSSAPVDIGWTVVRLEDQIFATQVIFAEENQPSLLGVVTLEDALLAVDPVGQRLVPVEAERLAMASSNNLDTLSQDGELPLGPHPGRRSDDTPESFDTSPLMDQGSERDYTPDEDGGVVHYAPGDRPLCGNESMTAVYSDDPALVAGCADCLELVAEYLGDDNEHWAHCLHCRQEISAQNGVEWRRMVRQPCPHCGRAGW